MLLIPAMELHHNQCVHSRKDSTSGERSVVAENPLDIVSHFVDEGANRIQIVDVEAVITGEPENVDIISKIREQFPDLEVQVAGNIRKEEHIYVWLDAGASYVILSAQAARRRSFIEDMCIEFPQQILVYLEAKNGILNRNQDVSVSDYAKELEESGVSGIIYTNVPSSGPVNGENLSASNELAKHLEIPVFANGGINDLQDIKNPTLDTLGGVIVGKPIYEKRFSYADLSAALRQNLPSMTA